MFICEKELRHKQINRCFTAFVKLGWERLVNNTSDFVTVLALKEDLYFLFAKIAFEFFFDLVKKKMTSSKKR